MDRALNRNAATVLAGIFLFSIWGFWPSYFSRLLETGWREHFHGITLVSWCMLMVTQAYLIRSNQRPLHRRVGKLSYLLAPLVVISTIALAHSRYPQDELTVFAFYGLALPTGLLAQFLFAYGLAIYHRRSPAIHARYMVCTTIPLVPPIFDRIMAFYLLPPPQAAFMPHIGTDPLYSLISYSVADLALVGFSIWDWRHRKRLNVFPVVLAAFVAFQGLGFVLHRMAFWRSGVEWFLNLPLS
jgi:hypothetical protein